MVRAGHHTPARTPAPLLGERYACGADACYPLSPVQRETCAVVRDKIRRGIYRLEYPSCVICDTHRFRRMSDSDRYGLEVAVSICAECGLVQTNPRLDAHSYERFYDTEYRTIYRGSGAASHAYVREGWQRGELIYEYLEANCEPLLSRGSDLRVLDVGCGSGGILQYFIDKGHAGRGVDLDSTMVSFAVEEIGLDVRAGTVLGLPSDEAYDLVIYSHVLEHLVDIPSELGRVHDLVAPGGAVYVEVPGLRNIHEMYRGDFKRFVHIAHTYHFTLTTLSNMMRRYGFRRVAGDEFIRALFVKAEPAAEPPISEYTSTLEYLAKLERNRLKHAGSQ